MESTQNLINDCKERIEGQFQQRLSQLLPEIDSWGVAECEANLRRQGLAVQTTGVEELRAEAREAARQRAAQSVLTVETTRTYRLRLSWDEPADYFELYYSPSRQRWIGGCYLMQDWLDFATRPIDHKEAERLAELFGIWPELP